MLNIYRTLIAVCLVNGLVNFVVMNYLVDSRLVPAFTAIWFAVGYTRVFGRNIGTASFKDAFHGVLMSGSWPILPSKS